MRLLDLMKYGVLGILIHSCVRNGLQPRQSWSEANADDLWLQSPSLTWDLFLHLRCCLVFPKEEPPNGRSFGSHRTLPCLCTSILVAASSPLPRLVFLSVVPPTAHPLCPASSRFPAIQVLVLYSHLPLPGRAAAPRHHRALQAVREHVPLRALRGALHLPGPARWSLGI